MLVAGKTLRDERERRGLSLEAIATKTKIPARTLAAIEEDQIPATQAPFFYKSFVKQYAEALNLNYSAIEEAVNANVSVLPVPMVPGQDHHAPDIAPLRLRTGSTRWTLPILSLIAVMTACSALYAVVEHAELPHVAALQRLTSEAVSEIATAVGSATSSTGAARAKNQVASRESAAAAEAASANAPSETAENTKAIAPRVPGDDIFVRIAAVEKTWLSIEADGRSVYNGLLQPEDTKVFEGHDTAKIKTGNAGGLTVTFNGKEIGRLGERGQVRTVLFTRDQYEIVQPSLTSRLEVLPVKLTQGQ
jgi:cytoskeleton protein RodZ